MHLTRCAGGKHTTFETNNLIQSNRSVFLLMQHYSQAFFPTEISNVIFALLAGGHSTLTFGIYKKKEREISIQKNYYHSSNNRKPQNVREKVIIVTLYYVYWVIRSDFIWICNP